jgi:hypothetical protein
VNKGKMLQKTIGIDDNTKVTTLTRQQKFPSKKNDFLMEILSKKLNMRDMNTQFVNNEWVNNTPEIISSNAILSKNNATLVSDRILMLMRKLVIVV